MHRTSKNLIDACRTQHDNPLFPNSFFVRFFLTLTRQEKKNKNRCTYRKQLGTTNRQTSSAMRSNFSQCGGKNANVPRVAAMSDGFKSTCQMHKHKERCYNSIVRHGMTCICKSGTVYMLFYSNPLVTLEAGVSETSGNSM